MSLKWFLIGGLLCLMTPWSTALVASSCEELVRLIVGDNETRLGFDPDFQLVNPRINISVILVDLRIQFKKVNMSAIRCDTEQNSQNTKVNVIVPLQSVGFYSPNINLTGTLYNTPFEFQGPAMFDAKNLRISIRGTASELEFDPEYLPRINMTDAKVFFGLESWKANVTGVAKESADDTNRLLSRAGPDIFRALSMKFNKKDLTRIVLNSIFPSYDY